MCVVLDELLEAGKAGIVLPALVELLCVGWAVCSVGAEVLGGEQWGVVGLALPPDCIDEIGLRHTYAALEI